MSMRRHRTRRRGYIVDLQTHAFTPIVTTRRFKRKGVSRRSLLDDLDLVGIQAVEFVHEPVDVPIRRNRAPLSFWERGWG